ncbi:hypothetical protein QW3_3257 [Clostridioides difficile P74]|nr:hypothetical protein HMPREF1122_02758 [Clostridioides difficile 002-P50-2011]EHJ29378.1 hypothetical protein HMPREF1123_01769 [Clostridioides difficile 050-P50-2011]EQF45866.1 hypothetical protein QG7_3239 [Clostridioides difficile CD175]EQK19732.1 hypothetical protein QUY_3243 [Clostridioides difficile P71]EQK28743.1 hypothetical protein QW3_3257 [Clostridioides difficile P74]
MFANKKDVFLRKHLKCMEYTIPSTSIVYPIFLKKSIIRGSLL